MSRESAFVARMRALAVTPAARGLSDDAALLPRPDGAVVLSHDMLVEGVHFLPDDPPDSVAWKLCAVNASDLAAKGARPLGALIGAGLGGDAGWDAAFAEGLGRAIAFFHLPLLGGDTVALPPGGPRTLGMTVLGLAPPPPAACPARGDAQAGDALFVTGTLGDAGAGLALLQGKAAIAGPARAFLVDAYRRPCPPVALGPEIAPQVHAMADVSDGLLIDADRIARASGLDIRLDLAAVPLSPALVALRGDEAESRTAAATAGDDYQLLFTAPAGAEPALRAAAQQRGTGLTRIGTCRAGRPGLSLEQDGTAIPLPPRLGYEHDA